MDELNLICPHCRRQIEIAQAVVENIRKRYEQEQQLKHNEELATLRREFEEKNKLEVADLQKRLREEIGAEQAKQLELERENNAKLRVKIDGLLEKLNTETEARKDLDVDVKERIMAAEEAAREEAQKQATEKYHLQLEEGNKKIADLEKQAEAMQHKANQVSGQLKGEVLELTFENELRAAFPEDTIEEVSKGVRGADVQQTVHNQRGVHCGTILWESKNARNWKDDWIHKLKEDVLEAKAHIPAMVSIVLPEESASGIICYQGVWIAKPGSALILARLLRMRLIEIQQAMVRRNRQETNAEALYDYITGHAFTQRVNSMLTVFAGMKEGISKERRALEKAWARREAELNKLLQNTAHIIGSMEGAIGADSMPKIESLSLDMLEFEGQT